jgi:hypothetical protein
MSYIYCAEVGTVGGWVSTFPLTRPVMGKFQKMVSSPFKKKKKSFFVQVLSSLGGAEIGYFRTGWGVAVST